MDEYFNGSGIARRGGAAIFRKSAAMFGMLLCAYVALVFVAATAAQAVLSAVFLGCVMAGIGFNVQHDGGHGSCSERKRVNRLMALSLDLLGGSSYFWNFKHNVAHHTYPNVSGSDDDIYLGPLARLSPHDRRFWFHRFQHIYMWGLYGLLALKWQLVDDFHSMLRPGFGQTHVPRPRGGELWLFCAGKLVFFGLAIGVPLLFHSAWKVAALFAVTGATLGFVLGCVFQLAHCVEQADYQIPVAATGRLDREWAVYQVESAVDFARSNRFVTWFLGGLNFQIEHHLFPGVCHLHYPALSAIVEPVCAAHGVRYRAHESTRAAVGSHYRWLRRLGRPG